MILRIGQREPQRSKMRLDVVILGTQALRGLRHGDAALELTIKAHCAVVGEGQDLGQDHAGNMLLRVEPVIGVVDTRPGHAPGAAAVGPRLGTYHIAETPFARDTREEIKVIRTQRHRGFRDAGINVANLVLTHQRDGLRAQQPDAIEGALMHQHLQKDEIIASGRIEASTAGPELTPWGVGYGYRLE